MKDSSKHKNIVSEEINFEKMVIDNVVKYVYVVDIDKHEIMYANETFKNLFGFEDKDIKTAKCYELFRGYDVPCHFCNIDKLTVEEEQIWQYHDERFKKDFRIKDYLITEGNRRFRVSLGEECSSQYTLLEYKDEIQNAINQCVETLNKDNDAETNIGEILGIIKNFYDAERVCIFKLDDLKQNLSCSYVFGVDGYHKDVPGLQKIPLSIIPHWMDMLENGGFVYVDSVRESIDPESAKFKILELFGVKNLIATPIIQNGEITGFVLSATATIHKNNVTFLKAITVFIKDAINKKHTNLKLETLLNFDRLTGLFNRHYYDDVISRIKNEYINDIGIIYIDVNGLKKMNDNFGHSYGDCYIDNCASLIRQYFPDEAFRVGGDEFVVLTNTLKEDEFNLKVEAFKKDIDANKKVSMSLGVVWCESYVNIERCIKKADILMYESKANYYANICDVEEFFARNVIDMLQRSAGEQNLKVLYQPKVNLDTQEFVGAEAFLYKIDEEGNYIQSEDFIPEYESLGNMNLLDLYVLEKGCELINNVDEELKEIVFTSMKFSEQTILTPNIHIECREICEKLNVDTSKFTIEVSENSGFAMSEEIFDKLQLFRKEGFKLSIENFGELNNKKEIVENHFDKVKLSKNLLNENNENVAVTKYAILDHLIKNYKTIDNVEIIINGIEEEEHLAFLSNYSGLIGQGNLISKPLLKQELLEYIVQNSRK